MIIIPPSAEIIPLLFEEEAIMIMKHIEKCARVCYKSEGNITEDSYEEFLSKIVNVKKHESVIEHCCITVKFTVDRGVSHELVRHRIAAFSQESTRYCNYSKEKFSNSIQVICPLLDENSPEYFVWYKSCADSETSYFDLLKQGCSPQIARSVLPNSLKTEVVMTCNLREWRHVFKLRTSQAAHPQMRQVMIPLLQEFQSLFGPLFNDIKPNL